MMAIVAISPTIGAELQFLLYSFVLGIGIAFFYDILIIFRNFIAHGKILFAMEDIIFWIVFTYLIFLLQCFGNNGITRWFSIGSTLLGIFILKKTISPIFVSCITKIIREILKIISFPIKKLIQKLHILFSYFKRKMGRKKKIWKRELTSKKKLFKITINNIVRSGENNGKKKKGNTKKRKQ
ncbi:MAG: spore cortex biosynthesis protein YabQ [Lachnospiraceae bacterium]